MLIHATLNTHVTYRDGFLDHLDHLDEPVAVAEAAVVETNLRGWGDSNAVVWYDGNHFLATISE